MFGIFYSNLCLFSIFQDMHRDLTSLKKGEIAKNVSLSSSCFRAEQTFSFTHSTRVMFLLFPGSLNFS